MNQWLSVIIRIMSTLSPQPAEATTPAPLARHGQLKAGNTAATVLKFVAVVVAVVLVSTVSIAAVAVHNITSAIRPGVALQGEEEDALTIGTVDGPVNLLLVGSDSGEGNLAYGERDATLNDVTMLLRISADRKRATVVSFPRDLFVDIPECPNPDGGSFPAASSQKINQSLSRGGLACPVLTVENLTGLEIPYAAKIEFGGVIEMSNAVGGVEVCVASPIDDRNIPFKLDAGTHTLSGIDALHFLRTRYGVGDGSDLTRISNQQQFLSSLVRTLKSSETLSNPVKLYGIASAASRNLEFSNSLRNVDTMVAIAGALKDIPLEEVVFARYPIADATIGGQSGVAPIADAADALFTAIAADLPIGLTGGTGGGTVADPNAPVASPESSPAPVPAEPVDPNAPVPSGSPAPEAPPTRVELPDTVQGTTAGEVTCSAGQTAGRPGG